MLGSSTMAALFALELLAHPKQLDVACVFGALALGAAIGTPLAWATATIKSRLALSALLLIAGPVLGAAELAWALRRAIELDGPVVRAAAPLAAFPLAAAVGVTAHRGLLHAALLGKVVRTAIVLALAVMAFSLLIILAHDHRALSLLALAAAGALLGIPLLGSGWLGPIGPAALAAALCWAVLRVDPIYFELRAVLVSVAAGAALLAGRELAARRTPWVRRRGETAAVLVACAMCAFAAERAIAFHPHSHQTSLRPGGAFSVAVDALSRVADADHDGHGVLFGERDCAPLDGARSPGAHEVPGNGIDDDCALGDATSTSVAFLERELAVNARPPRFDGDVVFVLVDTLRADAVGPGLKAFARQGRSFTRAYPTASFTAQSLVGILAGELPTAAEYAWIAPHAAEVHSAPPTLIEVLREQGFSVGMAGGIAGPLFARFFRGAEVARPLAMDAEAAETTRTAIATWRDLDPSKRRFLYVHYLELHSAEARRAPYYARAATLDRELGALFAAIGDDAMWIVTGDHGEAFGEHGVRGHSTSMYHEVLHVPLIVRYPGVAQGEEHALTSLLGLAPTVLAMVAPERLRHERGPYFCLGQADCGDVPVASALEKPRTHMHSLIQGQRHAIHDLLLDQRWEFDLASDPHERKPLPLGATSRRLQQWEQQAFVQGARVSWFRPR